MRNNRCVRLYQGSVNRCECASCRFVKNFESRAIEFFNSCPYRIIPDDYVYSFVNTDRDRYPQRTYGALLEYAFSVRDNINDKRKLAGV